MFRVDVINKAFNLRDVKRGGTYHPHIYDIKWV